VGLALELFAVRRNPYRKVCIIGQHPTLSGRAYPARPEIFAFVAADLILTSVFQTIGRLIGTLGGSVVKIDHG